MNYAAVPQVARDDNVDVLDQSEKEYNRMISQHMTYHKLLMDDLMKLSTVYSMIPSRVVTTVPAKPTCIAWQNVQLPS